MSPNQFPEPPLVSGIQLGRGQTRLRFEDVAQDGRLRLEGIWPAIGPILWGKMEVAEALLRLGAQGIRAVLSYVQLEGGSEPVSVRALCEQEVRWRIGHTTDADGQLNRLVFDTWLSTSAPLGESGNPGAPPVAETRVRVARAYGQHVFTRPVAAPGRHRVLSLADPLLDDLPGPRVSWRDPLSVLDIPDAAELLDVVPRPDLAPTVFGLCHTDGNQHVNFLSYPRLVEEAALRRFAELGLGARRLARRAEVGYRKPCFAGDVMRIVMQAYRSAGELGVVAAFVADEAVRGTVEPTSFAAIGRPHCVARVTFPEIDPGT